MQNAQEFAGCKADLRFHSVREPHKAAAMTSHPLDDIRQLLDKLPDPHPVEPQFDAAPFDKAGRLADLASWLKSWSAGKSTAARPSIAIFVGAHGLLPHGIAVDTDADARSFVEAAGQGTATISRICAASNIGLKVLELALDYPTADISRQAALDQRGAAATVAFGMEAAAGGNDLLCLSSVGAGGDVAAAAVLAAVTRSDGRVWVNAAAPRHLQMRQADLVGSALSRVSERADGLTLIAEVGGREIAAIAGAIIAARTERIPVVLDGLPALAAALALDATRRGSVDHCQIAASPDLLAAAQAAERAGLAWLAGDSLRGGPGVDSAVAVQTLRLAAESRRQA